MFRRKLRPSSSQSYLRTTPSHLRPPPTKYLTLISRLFSIVCLWCTMASHRCALSALSTDDISTSLVSEALVILIQSQHKKRSSIKLITYGIVCGFDPLSSESGDIANRCGHGVSAFTNDLRGYLSGKDRSLGPLHSLTVWLLFEFRDGAVRSSGGR